ncbi:hypothetical protein D3P96_00520 [Weissella viridescens]|uniref:Uncharacterized protein n=1 Tax=Weissella viridescens TaxID=1629 RepID=A0A3P2RD05_WEIVI|nr:hypothetical protein [Weissella viridescens]RRG18503.1 hypothetical protein D3P96_00520 [Weissella viridescens]
MQKKQNFERLRVGRDGDAWRREAPDVLDLHAPIFEPIAVKDPQAEMAVHFSERTERVPRETWYRLLLQECQKVTQPDMRIRSIVLDRRNAMHILFVMPDVSAMQVLTVFVGDTAPRLKRHQMWTGYYASIRDVLKVVRQYLSNQRYQSFSFAMYSYLRLNQQGILPSIQAQQHHYYVETTGDPIGADETHILQVLQGYDLLHMTSNGLEITALGISALNFFARFYEREFTQRWQTGAVEFTLSNQSIKSTQRKEVQLAREVVKNDR